MKTGSLTRTCRICVPVMTALLLCLATTGCAPLLNSVFDNALPPMEGVQTVPGLAEKVTVQRDNMGIPMIDAASLEDLVFAMGYVSAYDRFTQMEGFRLVGQGRLSELIGKATLEMDIYLRALNVNQVATILYESASPELLHMLKRYSEGVNAYMDQAPRPMTLKLAGYTPEPWTALDSVRVFVVLTLGLAQNLHEEINMLNVARKVAVDDLAWLFPIYPDEPLPFDEIKKLQGLDLTAAAGDIQALCDTARSVNQVLVPAAAASNNWAVSGRRTRSGKPILANDTHLPLCMPSIWHMMHLKCPGLEGAGVALAGVPGIIAGYNGHMAVGMTMVMADNQDVFLEKIKREPDGLYYLYKDQWKKAAARQETFRIKGEKDTVRTIYETANGVLMNDILTVSPRHDLMPQPVNNSPLGIAVKWAVMEPDQSMETFFSIMRSKSVDEVLAHTRKGHSIIPLNLVMADEKDIAWQVTGRYPLRKKGRGLCPSPGWTGEYGWEGYLDPALHPSVKNPDTGYVGTANHRTVPADFPHVLSSSWYYPDRAQRIQQMIETTDIYDADTARAMQLDDYSVFTETVKSLLLDPAMAERMTATWQAAGQIEAGQKALDLLSGFDGRMAVDSPGAALYGAFLFCLGENLFADEMGGTGSQAYHSLLETFLMAYSALHDHLTDRCETSPFWDDITTPEKEQRPQILADTLADAVALVEKRCGKDTAKWQWGKLHTATWKTDASLLADYMGFFDRTGIKFLSGYFDRGPYPAPGDHTTLNVAAYYPGKNFDVWLIPAMRVIADFGGEEPLTGINSSGQSDNPASPHYDDGITAWREGRYKEFPFAKEGVDALYTNVLTLEPAAR
ncbi:penicillin acylase family protein [Desulfosudis oleivorans]|uniref:Penicillin amidase n=1 Tax=Desulfosudis oleivorans (strain DSM 6200 / JCM 39069 / Hxd3) TaxID=96561 RepID=A8ZXX4_DESOH|nr:penicillin acylase family protein [Desulfosudis oleivorans]ABW68601.1 Penicillin amidase [Desulfosudis oleivorans Hxd3]